MKGERRRKSIQPSEKVEGEKDRRLVAIWGGHYGAPEAIRLEREISTTLYNKYKMTISDRAGKGIWRKRNGEGRGSRVQKQGDREDGEKEKIPRRPDRKDMGRP